MSDIFTWFLMSWGKFLEIMLDMSVNGDTKPRLKAAQSFIFVSLYLDGQKPSQQA